MLIKILKKITLRENEDGFVAILPGTYNFSKESVLVSEEYEAEEDRYLFEHSGWGINPDSKQIVITWDESYGIIEAKEYQILS